MKRILVDMDEVIADTTGGMAQWYKTQFGGNIDYEKMLKGKSIIKGFPEQHQELVRQRLYEPGFFRNLPVIDNSVEVLKEVNKKFELFIVSAATEFPNSLKEKHDWLLEHFPFLTWRQLVLCGDKRMITGDIMIDDHSRNFSHFQGKPYLFNAPHNLDESGFERIKDWNHAASLLFPQP